MSQLRYARIGSVFVLREVAPGLVDYVEIRKDLIKKDEKDKIAKCVKCGENARYLDNYAPYQESKNLCEECFTVQHVG